MTEEYTYGTANKRLLAEVVGRYRVAGWMIRDTVAGIETIYAACHDGTTWTHTCAIPNTYFNPAGAIWTRCASIPAEAVWIGQYPIPASISRRQGAEIESLRLRITGLEAAIQQVMRDHRAQLPSEARDLGCTCPQCDRFQKLGITA